MVGWLIMDEASRLALGSRRDLVSAQMIRLHVNAATLERVRFAVSPVMEATESLRALRDPEATALHLPWIREARARPADLDLAPLFALMPPDRYTPDFINPPPRGPFAGIDEELATVAAAPPDIVARELAVAYRGREVAAAARPLLDDPSHAIPAVAELIRAYFDRTLAPHW